MAIKQLMVISMSNTKKIAESFLTSQLPQVLDNLVKIACLKSANSTAKEWTDEIADKHLTAIRRCVNNLSTKKGVLDKDIIQKVWKEIFTFDGAKAARRAFGRNPKYAKMPKHILSDIALDALVDSLRDHAIWFSKEITKNDVDQDDKIASMLSETAVRHQNK